MGREDPLEEGMANYSGILAWQAFRENQVAQMTQTGLCRRNFLGTFRRETQPI